MNKQEVIDLMKSSNSEEEWAINCDRVRKEFSGYPAFWYKAIILSGLEAETAAKYPLR